MVGMAVCRVAVRLPGSRARTASTSSSVAYRAMVVVGPKFSSSSRSHGPGWAREVLRGLLLAWGHEHQVDDAAVVVSELVTNAVQHAGERGQLRLVLGVTGEVLRLEFVHANFGVRLFADPERLTATWRYLVVLITAVAEAEPGGAGHLVADHHERLLRWLQQAVAGVMVISSPGV